MNSGFQFGKKGTWEFGMHVEKLPTLSGAVRKHTTVSVAGRSGDLHYVEDAFENYTQSYECYFHGRRPTPDQAHAIKGWLLGSGTYQRLEDVYDPEHYRMATFTGPLDIENHLNKYGRCVVKFDCAPQAFLKKGEFPIDFESREGTIYNPTAFTALPLICLYGTGAGNLSVNDVTVDIHDITQSLILDCEMQNAYYNGASYQQMGDGPIENKNSSIYAPEFPVLKPGINTFKVTGNIDALRIIPRWWEL